MRFLASLWLGLSISAAMGAEGRSDATVARIGSVELEIPGGFSGPHRKFPTASSELQNYVEVGGAPGPTLIQLSHITVLQASPNLSEEQRYLAASDFLDGFLATFSQNATNWSRSPNVKVRLGGYLGTRATWTGHLGGLPCTGTMYFLVLGRDSFSFHAFGRADKPNIALRASIHSIEALRVVTADKSAAKP